MGKLETGIKQTPETPEPDSASEVNIILLGRTGSGKSSSGNTILGEKQFESKFGAKSQTRECKEATAFVSGRRVTVLDTPGLYDTKNGMERIEEEIQKVEEFSRRARCLFLLVIELGRFTEEEEKTIEKLCQLFPHEPWSKFLILFTNGDRLEGTIEEFLEEADYELKELMNQFDNGYHVFNNKSGPDDGQVPELLEKIDGILMRSEKENGVEMTEEDLSNPAAVFNSAFQNCDILSLLEGEDDLTPQEPLRLVLLGATGTGKSATGNTILGRCGFESKRGKSAVTKESKKLEGMVCGRKVAVVDTPGFFGNSGTKEEITEEAVKSVLLSAPGPHAFLLVISLDGRLTTQDKITIKEVQEKFGDDVKKYTIILFSHLDKLGREETIKDVIESDPELVELLRPFEGRIHSFDNTKRLNRNQVRELLEKIDAMVEQNGGGCYTDEMHRVAQEAITREAERLFRENEEEIRRRVEQVLNERSNAGQDENTAGGDETTGVQVRNTTGEVSSRDGQVRRQSGQVRRRTGQFKSRDGELRSRNRQGRSRDGQDVNGAGNGRESCWRYIASTFVNFFSTVITSFKYFLGSLINVVMSFISNRGINGTSMPLLADIH